MAAAFAVLSVVALWAPWSAPPADTPPPERVTFQIVPSAGLTFLNPAVSPNGRQIVVVVRDNARATPRLWLRSLDSSDMRELPGTDMLGIAGEGSQPFWSFDSRYIVLPSRDGQLKKLDVTNGTTERVTDLRGVQVVVGGAWNRDGVIVYAPRPGFLMRVPQAGGEAVSAMQAKVGGSYPVLSS